MAKFASFEGFEAAFYNTIELQNSWGKLVSRYFENVDTETIKYAAIGSSKGIGEWKVNDTRKTISPKNYELTISNRRYEDNIQIPKSAVERDKLGLFEDDVRGMASGFENHWNTLVSSVISTNPTGYDGVSFIGATHPLYDGSTQTNALTATEVPALDVSSTSAPTAEEASKFVAGLIAYMQNYKAENGQVATNGARKFVIVCGSVSMYTAVFSAVHKDNLASGESNVITSLLSKGYSIDVELDTTVGSATVGYIMRVDGNKPFILQSERGIEFTSVTNPNDGYVAMTGNFLFGAVDWRGAGIGDWRSVAKFTIS